MSSERPFSLLHINFETHFHKIYKKITGRVNLLRLIRFSIDTIRTKQIYQSIIMSIFTYCGYNSLAWSESRKRMIHSIEKGSLEIISPKYSKKNCDLRFFNNLNFCQRKRAVFVFDCLLTIELYVSHLGIIFNDFK